MKVGWVGLGGIGKEMALRVLGAGHELVAYDRGAGKAEVAAAGATMVANHPEVAGGCDVLCLCLFNDDQVREVMLDGGALAAMQAGSVLAIHTTGSPRLMRELGECAPAGVAVLDACFSGSAEDTARGDLTLMVGGEAEALERARPVLSTYAARINHMGPLGTGQTVKLLNNLLFATNVRQAEEVLGMAAGQGLDPKLAAQVICQSSGGSMAMGLMQNGVVPVMMESIRHYMVKDVKAVADAARDSGIDISAFDAVIAHYG
jgi:3-hydroxyisobutyrate dehydrogenase